MMTKTILLLAAFAGCTDEYSEDNEPPPIANDDHVVLAEDEPLSLLTLAENDIDVNNVKVIDMPLHGTIENGKYLPEPGYFGLDQFTYEGRRSQYSSTSAPATAFIKIGPDGIGYEHSMLLSDTNARDLAVGDLDGDGQVDLITCSPSVNEMTVFRNVTAGPEQYAVEPYRFEGGISPIKIAVVDLDRDGRLDIVTAAYDGLTMFRNLTVPQGQLAFAGPVVLAGVEARGLAVADLDGDGRSDLATIENVSYADGRLHVWLNRSSAGTLAFGARTTFATPRNPTGVVAVDADANGRSDLAVLADEDKLSLFVNAMAVGANVPAFAARIDRGTAPDPSMMFLTDLDGDARSEIGVLHDRGILWIYANRATGSQVPSFEAARVVELPYATALVQPAELDGDGVTDLVGAATGTAPFSFLHNQSQPQSYAFDLVEASIADIVTHKRAAFAYPSALAFVDLDGVPPLEIVVASQTGGSYDGKAGLRVLYGP